MLVKKPNLRGPTSRARLETRGSCLSSNTILSSQVVKAIQPSLFYNSSNYPPCCKILQNTMSVKEGYETVQVMSKFLNGNKVIRKFWNTKNIFKVKRWHRRLNN